MTSKLTDELVAKLAVTLNRLRKLFLTGSCKLTSQSVEHISKNFSKSLETLSFSDCPLIGNDSLQVLCHKCLKLTRLCIDNTGVTKLIPQLLCLRNCDFLKVDKLLVDQLIVEKLAEKTNREDFYKKKYWKVLKKAYLKNHSAKSSIVLNQQLLNDLFPDFNPHSRLNVIYFNIFL